MTEWIPDYEHKRRHLQQLYQAQIGAMLSPVCSHGSDCPVCRAGKEAEAVAKEVKNKEYKKRCEKYMKEWKERYRKRNEKNIMGYPCE